jgi:hypothetical protein
MTDAESAPLWGGRLEISSRTGLATLSDLLDRASVLWSDAAPGGALEMPVHMDRQQVDAGLIMLSLERPYRYVVMFFSARGVMITSTTRRSDAHAAHRAAVAQGAGNHLITVLLRADLLNPLGDLLEAHSPVA